MESFLLHMNPKQDIENGKNIAITECLDQWHIRHCLVSVSYVIMLNSYHSV